MGLHFAAVAGGDRDSITAALPAAKKPSRTGCLITARTLNGASSYDPEARCHPLLNNVLEASTGRRGNYLYVSPLKDMSTHGTSRQPAP